jgi:hypothetical protein
MAIKLFYRTEVAGVAVVVKDERTLTALFKKLGGAVLSTSDKGLVMRFPDRTSADEFVKAAKRNGAIFDSSVPVD